MGCDIHLYVEARENGAWVSKDKWTPDEPEEGEAPRVRVDYHNRIYSGRNYNLFAILANVRNGYGFAGCDTGDGFVPISDPKGLPHDVSDLVRAESDAWDSDGHSHSWHAVADLLAYDWTQTTKLRGWVNGPEWFDWVQHKRARGDGPEGYCGGVSGVGIDHVTAQEMDRKVLDCAATATDYRGKLKAVEQRLSQTYAVAEWQTPYYVEVSEFLGNTMPRLWLLGSPEDVRIVFWFDN